MKRRRANTSHTNVAIFKDISRAARIYEQSITWGVINSQSEDANSFNLSTILVYCTCKYYNNETCVTGKCCSHIIGQLRRTLYLTTRN